MAKKQDMIAYCGLYCGDCFGHTQKIADLARDLRKELRRYRFDKMADMLAQVSSFKEFKNYEKCYSLLGTMVKMRCIKTCRGNGGPPECGIRNCARKKKLDGCWQCDDLETCEKLKILEPHHGPAYLKNLRKIKKQGPAAFIKGKRYWYAAK
jgi:hypothetical protein